MMTTICAGIILHDAIAYSVCRHEICDPLPPGDEKKHVTRSADMISLTATHTASRKCAVEHHDVYFLSFLFDVSRT